jgi:hypothetical protein
VLTILGRGRTNANKEEEIIKEIFSFLLGSGIGERKEVLGNSCIIVRPAADKLGKIIKYLNYIMNL